MSHFQHTVLQLFVHNTLKFCFCKIITICLFPSTKEICWILPGNSRTKVSNIVRNFIVFTLFFCFSRYSLYYWHFIQCVPCGLTLPFSIVRPWIIDACLKPKAVATRKEWLVIVEVLQSHRAAGTTREIHNVMLINSERQTVQFIWSSLYPMK